MAYPGALKALMAAGFMAVAHTAWPQDLATPRQVSAPTMVASSSPAPGHDERIYAMAWANGQRNEISVQPGQSVTLEGVGTSRRIGPTQSRWTQATGPRVDLFSPDRSVATFVAPPVAQKATLSFAYQYKDASGANATDLLRVNVLPNGTKAR